MNVLTPVSKYNVEGAGISEIRNISIALHGAALQKTMLFLVTTLRMSDSSYSCCNLCPCFVPYVTLFSPLIFILRISGNRLVGIVNIEFCHIQNSESMSLHLSRYQILQCRMVPKYW